MFSPSPPRKRKRGSDDDEQKGGGKEERKALITVDKHVRKMRDCKLHWVKKAMRESRKGPRPLTKIIMSYARDGHKRYCHICTEPVEFLTSIPRMWIREKQFIKVKDLFNDRKLCDNLRERYMITCTGCFYKHDMKYKVKVWCSMLSSSRRERRIMQDGDDYVAEVLWLINYNSSK